jgi:hypothetical protein
VQRWGDGNLTMDIGVVGKGGAFADVGDSGSLCIAVRSEVELLRRRTCRGRKPFSQCSVGHADVGGAGGYECCHGRDGRIPVCLGWIGSDCCHN